MAYVFTYKEKGKRKVGPRIYRTKKAARRQLGQAMKGATRKERRTSRYKNPRIKKI